MEEIGEYRGGGRSVRDWAVDVVFFVAAVLTGIILFFTNPDVETASRPLLGLDLVAGSALCVALWWRRRWPVQLGIVASLIGMFSAMSGGAGLVMLFTVAVHRRPTVVWALAGFGLVTAAPFELLRGGGDSMPFVGGMVFAALLILSVIALGMFVRARRQLVLSLRLRAVRAETEQQLRVEQARLTERTRIAREMHDVLAHRISLVSLHAGALEFHPDAPAADVARSAAVIRQSAHQALEDLREILGVLRLQPGEHGEPGQNGRPVPPEAPMPTLADVPRLVEESRAAGMDVRCSSTVTDADLVPPSIGRTAYRVVQEGLTNARKHAAGAAAQVSLSGGPGTGLAVEVRNLRPSGRMLAPAIPGAGQGLTGLAERAEVAGGRLEHGPDGPDGPDGQDGPDGPDGPVGPDGSGWTLRAWLPWASS